MEDKEEVSYWIGVLTGAICSLIIVLVMLFIFNNKLSAMEDKLKNLERVQTSQSEWISENETVMKTYEFFNEAWEGILEYDINKNKE